MIENKTALIEGFHLGSQTPIDDRLLFTDLASLIDMGPSNNYPYKYYEGMRVWVVGSAQEYEWKESSTGAMPSSFDYSSNWIVSGVDYSGRGFNFVATGTTTSAHDLQSVMSTDNVTNLDVHYGETLDKGILWKASRSAKEMKVEKRLFAGIGEAMYVSNEDGLIVLRAEDNLSGGSEGDNDSAEFMVSGYDKGVGTNWIDFNFVWNHVTGTKNILRSPNKETFYVWQLPESSGVLVVLDTSNNLPIAGQTYSVLPASPYSPSGTSQIINLNYGNGQVIDLGNASGDVTINLINPKAGASYFIKIIQGATFRDVIFPSTVKFPGQTAPYTLDVTEVDDAIDSVVLFYDGTNFIANFSQNHG